MRTPVRTSSQATDRAMTAPAVLCRSVPCSIEAKAMALWVMVALPARRRWTAARSTSASVASSDRTALRSTMIRVAVISSRRSPVAWEVDEPLPDAM